MPEPIKELEELKRKNNLLESKKHLLVDKIKKFQKNEKLYQKQISDLKNDIASIEKHIDLKRCESCNELVPETIMCYVGNESICEECSVNGYGR